MEQTAANLSALINNTGDLVWSVDLNYGLLTFNSALVRYYEANFGITPAVGMRPADLLPADRAARWPVRYERALKEGSFLFESSRADGRITQLTLNRIDVNGQPAGVSVFGRDITELRRAAEELRRSEERYSTVFQTSFDGILINRLDNQICIDVNPMFLQFMGFERGDIIGKSALEIGLWAHTEDRERMFELLRRNRNCHGFEAEFRRKNGEITWALLSASVIEINKVPCLITIARDISDAKAAEREIRHIAFYDALTGLPNRRLLLDRLRQSVAAGGRNPSLRALLFLDLDNFKSLNDTRGHHTGDLLLQEVGRRLASCVRAADSVGRLGGDEFLIILDALSEAPERAVEQARQVAQKVLARVNEPYMLDGLAWHSTSSVGIAVFGKRGESADEILREADIAMYEAKSAGRNTFRFFRPAASDADFSPRAGRAKNRFENAG